MDFPRYDSKKALTTDRPEPLRDEAAAQGKLVTGALDVATDMAVKWNEKVEKVQADTALYNYKVGMLEIENEAALSTDIGAEERYQKRVKELRQNVTKGASQRVVNSLTPELDYLGAVGSLGIKKEFMKKVATHEQTITLGNIQLEINNPTENSEKNIEAIVDKSFKDGFIADEKEAHKLKVDSIEDVRFNRFLQEYRADPIAAEKKFNENGYGLNIETKEKALSKLKELQRFYKDQEGERFYAMGLDIMTGNLSDRMIEQQMEINKINPNEGITVAHGKQLKRNLYRDIKTRIGAEQYKKYKKAIDFVFSDSEENKIATYEAVLAAYSEGLDQEDTKFLGDILKQKKNKEWRSKTFWLKEAILDAMGSSMTPADIENKNKALLSFARKISAGVDPEIASKEVVFDQLKKEHPALQFNPDLDATYSPTKGMRPVVPKVKQDKK